MSFTELYRQENIHKMQKESNLMTKKTIVMLLILILVLALGFILFKIVRVQDIVLKAIYPTEFSEYVEKYAEENNVDKYLVYAIIKAESNFNPEVTSGSGAKGLMQLMEETAIERSNVIYDEAVASHDLYDPETNIALGCSYFAYLLGLYDGNTVLALTAYNAGLGNVEQWIKNEIIKPDGSDIENIPYKETNNYVRKILNSYQMYLKIYT